MNISSTTGITSLFNEITNSLMYVESYDILSERVSEIITQLPNVNQVSIVFHDTSIQKIKIGETSISIPINGIDQIFGYIEITGGNNTFATNELLNVLGIIANVTAATVNRIKKNNEYKILSNIAKETDYSIIITGYDGRIEWVNDGFVALTGYTIDEAKGKIPGELLQGQETDSQTAKSLSKAINKQEEIEIEILNYKKSGAKYWVNFELKPIFENGILTHYISIQKDISHLKAIEEELRFAKDLAESANEAKNRFLAITSHEIRTPLNIIQGMSKILLETDINETQLKYLRGIKSASQNLLLIINDLLDISKIEAGKLQLENIEFNIHQVAEDAMTFQSIKAKEKGIDLILEKDIRISNSLIGDPFRLNQILLNLLTNALKFTEKGSITLRYYLENDSVNENSIKFEITDTGIGIDNKKLDTIFDSYTQEDIAITRKYGGTGLGLTITKELVELFNGKISVKSDKTTGTTFTLQFTFPKNNISNLTENPKIIEKKDLAGVRVLLADDNELNQIITLTYLNKWGIESDTVFNGLEAVNKIKENTYDLVLMDIQMPEMNGIEATIIIRNELKITIPIIALTAHALNHEREEYMKNGLSDYLTKPIDEELLFKTILKYTNTTLSQEHQGTDFNDIIFNLTELRNLAINDDLFIPKIIRLFINQSADIPQRLDTAIKENNFEEIGYTIHQLKPSLSHLSVEISKPIISTIENNIHNNCNQEETLIQAKQLIEIIEKLVLQLKEEIKKY